MRAVWLGAVAATAAVISIGVASVAYSDENEGSDNKQQVEQQLRQQPLTPEQSDQQAAQLAEEQQRIAYADVADPEISPGLAFDGNGRALIRIYSDRDAVAIQEELDARGIEADLLPSRYTHAEHAGVEEALRAVPLSGNEALGFHYDATKDFVVVSGSVEADKLAAATGQLGSLFEYEWTDSAGRVSRD